MGHLGEKKAYQIYKLLFARSLGGLFPGKCLWRSALGREKTKVFRNNLLPRNLRYIVLPCKDKNCFLSGKAKLTILLQGNEKNRLEPFFRLLNKGKIPAFWYTSAPSTTSRKFAQVGAPSGSIFVLPEGA